MNCERFTALLDDYHDGTLDPVLRHACDEHLGACRRCQGELARLRSLARASAALAPELAPARDLWPGIASRLERRGAPSRGARLWQQALAATVVLAIGGLGALALRLPGRAPAPAVAQGDAGGAPAQGRAAFVAHLAAGGEGMAPETRAVVVRNLQIIERALDEIEAAVARDPNDPNLRALLTAIHQQESALIDQSQRITVKNAKRTDI